MSGEEIQAVPGTVTLMSDDPVEPGLRQKLQAQVERRPWLIPAVLMAAVALLVAARRH
jgi:hypothetical protein